MGRLLDAWAPRVGSPGRPTAWVRCRGVAGSDSSVSSRAAAVPASDGTGTSVEACLPKRPKGEATGVHAARGGHGVRVRRPPAALGAGWTRLDARQPMATDGQATDGQGRNDGARGLLRRHGRAMARPVPVLCRPAGAVAMAICRLWPRSIRRARARASETHVKPACWLRAAAHGPGSASLEQRALESVHRW